MFYSVYGALALAQVASVRFVRQHGFLQSSSKEIVFLPNATAEFLTRLRFSFANKNILRRLYC